MLGLERFDIALPAAERLQPGSKSLARTRFYCVQATLGLQMPYRLREGHLMLVPNTA